MCSPAYALWRDCPEAAGADLMSRSIAQFLYCGKKATLHIGNVKPIGTMPEGTIVCNLEEVCDGGAGGAPCGGGARAVYSFPVPLSVTHI